MATPKHIVAIFGGAISGAEAAFQFTKREIPVVVFEQNDLPYGKIEDGLPKWHNKLRDKEEAKINAKLSHPLVTYVPRAALGKNIDFRKVTDSWGFSAVLLATGAWKDRPLGIEGIDAYINKGLYYQNSFINWYNHFHEPNYAGMQYETPDDTIVIGGGLASLDVAKVVMFQNVEKALRKRGIEENLFSLDRSIAKVLEKHNLTLADLGLKGCTLYYRRRIIDMPLSTAPTDTPELLTRAQDIREKILLNYQSKYLFNVEPCCTPIDKIVENDRLVGLVMERTEMIGDKLVSIKGSEHEVRSSLVIASIGSIPEPIPGIPMNREIYQTDKDNCCRIAGFNQAFAIGNAVTGRGNIMESLKHGQEISQAVIEQHFDVEKNFEQQVEKRENLIDFQVGNLANRVENLPDITDSAYKNIQEKIEELHKESGYSGDFMTWVEKHLPLRLETIIGEH